MKAVLHSSHSRFVLAFLCFCCFGDLISSAEEKTLHPDEIITLKQIDAKLKVGWNFSVNPCSGSNGWYENNTKEGELDVIRNVACGNCDVNNTCRVVDLSLKSQNLTGFLPPEISKLTSLVQLDLTRNYINGTIPVEWAALPVLNISLGGNRISGKIPDELGNISSLQSLVLENNLLEGPIPSSIGRLQNLSRLILSGNYLTGQLPETMGNLKSLIDFRIDGSDISGRVPSFIGNWKNLDKLHMQGTSLEGPFPSEISKLQKITELQVSDFKGDGSFPPLQNMKLKILVLRNCSIVGELPEYIGRIGTLEILDLSFNKFTGEIPDSFRRLASSLKNLYFTNNMLTGAIPNWILTSRNVIDVSYNNFEGSLERTNCEQQGSLVNVFASSSSSENKMISPCLRKNFPCSEKAKNYELFINCGGGAVNIGGNQYDEDRAPMAASTFFLSNNKWAFSSTGDFFFNPLANYIARNSTMLNMTNPEIYMTARLSASSLKYYGLCLQNGNYTVNLHFSEIFFLDGKTFYSVGRRSFDVSIQGRNVLKDFDIVVEANGAGREVIKSFNATISNNTLEIGFRWSGKGTNSVPEKGVYGPLISAISVTPNFPPDIGSISDGLTHSAIIGIVIGSIVGTLLILLLLWLLMRRKYHEGNGLEGTNLQVRQYRLKQLISATGNFSSANKIGEGGFGPVFKGVLPDGTQVAVKQLSSKSKQGNREFINEIGMISALQHPNLVKLLGCCIEGTQLLLVYEYMENNSLFHNLFGPKDTRLKLDWKTRHNICLGVAKGLRYLHEESRIKVVHRDIKATNILLDKNMNAKISDFGLAKLDDDRNSHMSTRVAGTWGYMAPEYAMKGHLTDKTDVYSFGVVLLEVVSGKNNIIRTPGMEDTHVLEWANNLNENEKLLELVDQNLGSDYIEEEAIQMLRLAILCASTSPSHRPAMSKVVNILERKEHVEIPIGIHGTSMNEESRNKAFPEHSHSSHEDLDDSRYLIDGVMSGSSDDMRR